MVRLGSGFCEHVEYVRRPPGVRVRVRVRIRVTVRAKVRVREGFAPTRLRFPI